MNDQKGLSVLDRGIVEATQAGLPLTPRPYHQIGETLGLSADQVMARMRAMLGKGVIRRIGVIPNHYALGYQANGMSVWQVPKQHMASAGARVGTLKFVSHCYHRPPHPPAWPYNLFAMVHGRNRGEVEEKVAQISEALGPWDQGHEILYSRRILKKTGIRI